jgi:flagellar hook protein FlgE
MSFYTSVSGARGAQAEIATISNNLANAQTTGFKKSRVEFGDLFSSTPAQIFRQVPGQGVRVMGVMQQFSQGTLSTTDKALDLGIAGEGFFVVKSAPPTDETSYTRAGAFSVDANRFVIDTTGSRLQLMPVDAQGNVTSTTTFDFVMPTVSANNPNAALTSVTIGLDGLAKCNFSDGSTQDLGKVALASFPSQEGLRPMGDAHWQPTDFSGPPTVAAASTGALGEIRAGTLERANVEVTEEMVALIAAQRNFQANAKALDAESTMSQTIINIR